MHIPFQIFSQSDYLIQIVNINSHSDWQTVQIQISWLLQKPTDLDLHCLQRQGISGLSRTRVKKFLGRGNQRENCIKAFSKQCQTRHVQSTQMPPPPPPHPQYDLCQYGCFLWPNPTALSLTWSSFQTLVTVQTISYVIIIPDF